MSSWKFKSLILISSFISSYESIGQILKVDKNYLFSDSSGYTVGVTDLTFSANNRRSTDEEQIHFLGAKAGFDLVRIREKSATIWIGTINYTKLGQGPFISNGTGHLRQIFNRNAKLTTESFVQLQYDRSRKMQMRQLIGAGGRWHLLRNKNSLQLGLGVMNEQEEWGLGDDLIEKNIWKLNSYLGGEVDLTQNLKLNTIFYFQSGHDANKEVFRSRASGFLEIKNKVSKKLEAKISTEFSWDHRPIIPLNRLVYEVYFGLEYDF